MVSQKVSLLAWRLHNNRLSTRDNLLWHDLIQLVLFVCLTDVAYFKGLDDSSRSGWILVIFLSNVFANNHVCECIQSICFFFFFINRQNGKIIINSRIRKWRIDVQIRIMVYFLSIEKGYVDYIPSIWLVCIWLMRRF